ncbi:MAG: hypothetical protein Q8N23_13380 [Archangium sp.]|nr:hypothetical protein [Archangium sp.]MDP3569288.1 hypothetical protein [Archangium sp.]
MVKHLPLVLLTMATACGPSLSSLVRDHHYREAVCAVADGQDAEVVDAAVRAARAQLRAHRLSPAELTTISPGAPEALTTRAALVTVEFDSLRVPLDGLTAEVTLIDPEGAASTPATRTALIWATNETEPRPVHVKTGATNANALLALGYLITAGVPLVLGGAAALVWGRPFDPFPDRQVVKVDAPEREYERLAPIATALERTLPRCTPGLGASLRCKGILLVDPRVHGGTLRITVRARAQRRSRGGEELPEACVASHVYDLAWPKLDEDLDRQLATPSCEAGHTTDH